MYIGVRREIPSSPINTIYSKIECKIDFGGYMLFLVFFSDILIPVVAVVSIQNLCMNIIT